MSHIMIDLETFGIDPGCAVLSIGAVIFDPTSTAKSFKPNKKQDECFYAIIDLQSCLDFGCHVSGSTINWWMQQNPDALRELIKNPKPLDTVLRDFNHWFRMQDGVYPWSHGSGFDIVLLEELFRLIQKKGINGKPPWKFFNIRDTRTLFDIAGVDPDRSKGTHHNALDDAINQARAALKAFEKIRKGVSQK